MRTHHYCDYGHSLTLFSAYSGKEAPSRVATMNCGLNFVSRLHASTISFREHDGPLSIKCAFGGEEFYEVGSSRFRVDDDCYLILNEGQRYASLIEANNPIESFCIWFRPGFVADVRATLRSEGADSLEMPLASGDPDPGFLQRRRVNDEIISPIVQRVRRATRGTWLTAAWLEEQFHALAEAILAMDSSIKMEVDRVPAMKASRREELYRRLNRSRDFLEDNLSSPVSLSESAEVAELSRHYFLRLFQQVFGETPREYQSRRRMENARRLLANSEMTITDICFEVGFESLGSFSWQFRRRFGVPPSEYRRSRSSVFAKKAK